MNAELCRLLTKVTKSPYWRFLPEPPGGREKFKKDWMGAWMKANKVEDLPEEYQEITSRCLLFLEIQQEMKTDNLSAVMDELNKRLTAGWKSTPVKGMPIETDFEVSFTGD